MNANVMRKPVINSHRYSNYESCEEKLHFFIKYWLISVV